MEKFNVRLPFNGIISVQVEAENEEEAIENALSNDDITLDLKSNNGYQIEEWGIFETLLKGNVWYGVSYEADAEKSNF